jgi:hypothetical protein
VALQDDLERIAGAAARFIGPGEELTGILAAEPPRRDRAYLCAFKSPEGVSWLVLDDQGEPVTDLDWVRQVVTLVALAELAEESAGGGELDELRSRLVALRLTENPPGIDEAEEAVDALQRTLGGPPRLATAEFLDDVGSAAKRLEETLGESAASPFAEAMKQGSESVDALTRDVESHYKVDLQ